MQLFLQQVFDALPDFEIGIIGSAAYDPTTAADVDVLFLASAPFPDIIAALGLRYNGWDRGSHHLRRANARLAGVPLPVQLLQDSLVTRFDDYPYAVVLRDGTRLHGDVPPFVKSNRPSPRHQTLLNPVATTLSSRLRRR